MNIDIISTKALERQIKVLEEKILDLQSEVSALEKKREACHILLGVPLKPISESIEAAASAPKKPTKRKVAREENVEVEPSEEELATFVEGGNESSAELTPQ